jgi:cytochrome c oxidase subunit 1
MYTTLLVAIPTGIKFFSWTGTVWGGKISFETPMLFTLGAISIFLLGGLSGPPNATVATDLHLQDTYWIVGHFHATMFGGFIFPFFAAIYFWFPKITGRMYNEKLGRLHFFIMLPAFYVQSLGQMQIGLVGMRRRIADYDPTLGITTQQILITLAGYLIATAVLIAMVNLIYSAARGRVAVANPWRARSPEWQIPSPAPRNNYEDYPFEVIGEPYDYGLAGSAYVSIDKERGPAARQAPPPAVEPAPSGATD